MIANKELARRYRETGGQVEKELLIAALGRKMRLVYEHVQRVAPDTVTSPDIVGSIANDLQEASALLRRVWALGLIDRSAAEEQLSLHSWGFKYTLHTDRES